jgi:hypothetical protein
MWKRIETTVRDSEVIQVKEMEGRIRSAHFVENIFPLLHYFSVFIYP